MDQWIFSNNQFGCEKVYCWLDNCSRHKSKSTSLAIKNSRIKYIFLPAYSPMLAPVETAFRAFKARLMKQSNHSNLCTKSIEFKSILYKCMQMFSSIEIIGYFKHSFYTLGMYLNGKFNMLKEKIIRK